MIDGLLADRRFIVGGGRDFGKSFVVPVFKRNYGVVTTEGS